MAKKQITKAPEKVEEVKPVETTTGRPDKPETVEVKPKILKFKNVGKGMKIKLVDEKNKRKFKWITVKTGEVVSIPRKIALRNKLVEVK